ncbi:6-bladed beta-propeller [Ferrimonas sediminicola]|uniref:6-bladed beta-propeller n=1 Tax=Ferrimonas sediminicola TaxID=2569538 RepID=A0A4V5NXF2_9GAMM|nr:6-bladed beta-propeller [Ferrimonas sediminicola]TKB48292.1 6-bladed beta-propeller [Ferrimonas sediminicola]
MVRVLLLAMILLLTGCASGPQSSSLRLLTPSEQLPLMWPDGDRARYRFLGDLVGEANLQSESNRNNGWQKALEWLVGQSDAPLLRLQRPQGLTVDERGWVYVVDVGAAALLAFDTRGGQVHRWGSYGQRQWRTPLDVVLKGEELLISDADCRCIWRMDRSSGRHLGRWSLPGATRPVGLAWAADWQQLFVADSQGHRILVLDRQGQYLASMGQRGTAPMQFNGPTFLAYQSGKLLVSDTLNARLQLIDLARNQARVIGQRGSRVGNLARPKGVAFDSEGHLYVVESYFDHLLVFDSGGRLLLPLGGAGSEPGSFTLPSGLAVDGSDRVYVADMMNARVSVFQYLGENRGGHDGDE